MIKKTLNDHEIIITNDHLSALGEQLKRIYAEKELYIFTDENVYALYKNKLETHLSAYQCRFVVTKAGESAKTLANYQAIVEKLLKKGIKRHHLLLLVGGGVVGDLGGFIAATLYRGIAYVQVPTSLLAQVDSAIGGKVAIDLPAGKNLIGAFYSPKLIFIDTAFLKTLNQREYNNGIAEIIKVALIKNKDLYEKLRRFDPIDETMIAKAVNIKVDLVSKDPYDQNERILLNFGHTFGHAIEKAHHYQTYLHGEAISYGMLIALKIGSNLNVTDPSIYNDVKQLLTDYKLIKEPLLQAQDYIADIKLDKKQSQNGVRFVLLKQLGEATVKALKESELL